MTQFIDLEDALDAIAKLGFHVKELGLLDSALARPKTTIFGEDAYGSLELKAAALCHSLAKNHALVDGNKRITWTLLVSFLFVNDFKHDFTADEGMDFVLGIATDAYAIEEAAKIIRQHMVPLI
jgi:death-on-curing protein